MNREMQIIREVNIQAENFYDKAVQLGDHAAFALGRSRRSQMTGLENIADSALKTSDIFDYIKRQTARFSFWRQNFPRERQSRPNGGSAAEKGFGERLMDCLERELKEDLDKICSRERLNISKEDVENLPLQRRIHLLLIRQFIHQMVAEYEFRVSVNSNNSKKGA